MIVIFFFPFHASLIQPASIIQTTIPHTRVKSFSFLINAAAAQPKCFTKAHPNYPRGPTILEVFFLKKRIQLQNRPPSQE
jgi:hypothetical protein